MEPIFTLPYSEWEAMQQIQRFFRKRDGFSVLVPVSRQQKGLDFVVLNANNGKSLRFQVKASRSYGRIEVPKRSKKEHFKFNLWFNNFLERYSEGNADIYLFFGLYPEYSTAKTIKTKEAIWCPVILAFRDSELRGFLSQIKTKKEKKLDRFFGISGNNPHQVFGRRGFVGLTDLTANLLENKVVAFLNEIS